MNKIPLSEAELRLVELVDSGEAVTITRDGVPVARLVPIPARDQAEVDKAVEGLRRLAEGNRLDGLTIKELRDEGRR